MWLFNKRGHDNVFIRSKQIIGNVYNLYILN